MQDLGELRAKIRNYGRVLVCYSGGLDSTMLMDICMKELGKDAFAFTADLPMLSRRMRRSIGDTSRSLGFAPYNVRIDPGYEKRILGNTADRCYECKRAVYTLAQEIAEEIGAAHILCGDNADDDASDRPGMRAAEELGVEAPLSECGITRATVEEYVSDLGLPRRLVKETCMLMRYRPGTPLTSQHLLRAEVADARVRFATGAEQIRARIHDGILAVQTSAEEMEKVRSAEADLEKVADALGLKLEIVDEPYDG